MKKFIACSFAILIFGNLFSQENPTKTKEIGLVFSSLNSFGLRYKCGNEKTLFRITALVLNGTNTTNDYSNYSYNNVSDAVPSSSSKTLGGGLNIGIEKRKQINDKFYFFYGADLINSYNENKTTTYTPSTSSIGVYANGTYTMRSTILNNSSDTHSWTMSSGIGILIGAAYRISNSFSIAAELLPNVSYKYTKAITTSSSNYTTWQGNPLNPYSYDIISNSTIINKGITYALTNGVASITIAYRIK